MMQVQPRDGSEAQSPPAGGARYVEQPRPRNSAPDQDAPPPARPAGPVRPGGSGGSSGSGIPRVPRFFRPKLRWILYALVLWVVYLVAVPIMAFNNVTSVDAMPSGDRPAEQPGTTWLLVGSDSRQGLTKAQRQEYVTGGDVGQRTDTIMLLHTGSGPDLLASIPRDSQVTIPGHGTNKINAAFAYGGPELLVRTVEQDTGIRIDHYAEIGMGGVVNAVDAVGGIEICPKTRMKDPLAGLNIKKGCQKADGKTALAYSRSRHAQSLGDMGRAMAQREVVAQVGKKAVSPWTVLNPFRYWSLAHAAAEIPTVSKGTGPIDLAKFFLAMRSVGGDGMTCGVPINSWQVTWDPTRSKQFFDYIKQDKVGDMPKSLCTASGFPKNKG